MELTPELVTNIPPNLGEPVEPSPEFQEFPDPEPTGADKPLSVTCAVKEECSPPSTHGEDGTEELIKNKKDMPLLPLLPLPDWSPWFKLEDTELEKPLNSH